MFWHRSLGSVFMEYCAAWIFWWQNIVLIFLFTILFWINGKSFILARGIARNVREITGLLYGSVLGGTDSEGLRIKDVQRGPNVHGTQTGLQTITEG
uniref:V4 n=1 Tax=Capulavirus medicagonis TaxID=1306546 RepID=A0A3G3BJU9_9GEMI|nr:V4 [Alfalfa leaf curl virus]